MGSIFGDRAKLTGNNKLKVKYNGFNKLKVKYNGVVVEGITASAELYKGEWIYSVFVPKDGSWVNHDTIKVAESELIELNKEAK